MRRAGTSAQLLGTEALSLAYCDQPALIHEIMEHWVYFYRRLASRVHEGIQFDFVLIWEDRAYKNGSLISPKLVREFMLPYYRLFIDHILSLGCEVIAVDSDGDVSQLVSLFMSVGVNAMLPFEVQAGMDVREFRRRYGKNLAIIGGLDKRTLTGGDAAIEQGQRFHGAYSDRAGIAVSSVQGDSAGPSANARAGLSAAHRPILGRPAPTPPSTAFPDSPISPCALEWKCL